MGQGVIEVRRKLRAKILISTVFGGVLIVVASATSSDPGRFLITAVAGVVGLGFLPSLIGSGRPYQYTIYSVSREDLPPVV